MPKPYSKFIQKLQIILVSVVMVGFIGLTPVALAEDATGTTDQTTTTDVVPMPTPDPSVLDAQPAAVTTTPTSDIQSSPPDPALTPTPTPAPTDTTASTTTAVTNNDSTQTANTGDANVTNNDNVGNTTTGDSANTLDLLNMANNLQGATDTQPVIYVNNIQGDHTGDIVIDPTLLAPTIPTDTSAQSLPLYIDPNNAVVVTSTTLNNNVSMDSSSGNANVTGNDNVGNTATGNASNNADIINVANTIIGTGSYFIGIINVYGDLQGNIVIPSSIIDTLNQSYGLSPSQNNLSLNTTNSTDVTNNTAMNAASGQITLTGNDNTGGATTGDAQNALKILNYTGIHIFTGNTLLIIVNVMGQWYGMLLGQPDTTSATLSANNPTSGVSTQQSDPISLSFNATTKITNNLLMNALSGNATVTNNDDVGNVSTGNATNTARIMNISNSTLSLAHWFGILFINILGNWYGSVVNSPAVASANTFNSPTSPSVTITKAPLSEYTKKFASQSFYAPSFAYNEGPEANTSQPISSLSYIKDQGPMNFNSATNKNSQSWLWAILCAILGASMLAATPVSRLRVMQ